MLPAAALLVASTPSRELSHLFPPPIRSPKKQGHGCRPILHTGLTPAFTPCGSSAFRGRLALGALQAVLLDVDLPVQGVALFTNASPKNQTHTIQKCLLQVVASSTTGGHPARGTPAPSPWTGGCISHACTRPLVPIAVPAGVGTFFFQAGAN